MLVDGVMGLKVGSKSLVVARHRIGQELLPNHAAPLAARLLRLTRPFAIFRLTVRRRLSAGTPWCSSSAEARLERRASDPVTPKGGVFKQRVVREGAWPDESNESHVSIAQRLPR